MNEEQLGLALEKVIELENDKLEDAARDMQSLVSKELLRLINQKRGGLITDDNGRVIITGSDGAENRKRIASIKAALRILILGTGKKQGEFEKAKETYLSAFLEVEKLQSAYYVDQFKNYQKRPVSELLKSAQERTAELISAGLNESLFQPVTRIIDTALSGSSLRDIETEAAGVLETTFKSKRGKPEVKRRGSFDSYTSRLVRDTLNNFSGNVTQAVTASLGLEWVYYSRGTVAATRDFCRERNGKYFHIDEVRSWASMNWEGKNPNTTESNILALRGGYSCMHTIIPVAKSVVPKAAIDRAKREGFV